MQACIYISVTPISNSLSDSSTPVLWYVMRHLEMDRFKTWLDAKNVERLGQGDYVIEAFYPYDFLKGRQATNIEVEDDAASQKNSGKASKKKARQPAKKTVVAETHNDFIDIVFLKATANDVQGLVQDKWNKAFRVQLHYLFNPSTKRPATVSIKTMDEFFENCVKYRGRFEIYPSIDGIETKDRVEIKRGVFAGHEASVLKVRHSKGELHLELAVELVSGVMYFTMSDIKPSHVTILNKDTTTAIRNDFIEYTQNKILTIFEHRVKGMTDVDMQRKDIMTLNRLMRYRSYQVEGRSSKAHFTALMLICAHLLKDKSQESSLKEECLHMLEEINRQSASKAVTDTRTYLWIALYISTNDPIYRDACKQYVRDYAPKSPKLRKFVTLMRRGVKVSRNN